MLTQRTLAALAFIALLAAPASAQERRAVTGTVVDSGGRPVQYAMIDGGGNARALTNLSGEFRLLLPPKNKVEVNVRRIGFLPAKVLIEPGGDTTVTVTVAQLGIMMETQVIRAREQTVKLSVTGFYERMNQAVNGALIGEFVLPEEIEIRKPNRATQLFEGRRGIRVRRFGNCYDVTTCYRITGTGDCAATVYLDGRRLNPINQGSAAAGIAATPSIDDILNPSAVSAIEIYPRGSSAPPQFQSLAGTCAIVAIWTR